MADGGDQRGHELASLRAVGFAVGSDHALVDGPGRLDLDVVVTGEQGLETLLLLVGEQVRSGVQHSAGVEQWVAGAAAVPDGVLLDAAPASVQRVTGQTCHVERVMPTSA